MKHPGRWKTFLLIFLLFSLAAGAQSLNLSPDEVGLKVSLHGENFSRAVSVFLLITALSLAPAFIMMMTSFTRIVVVLSFLKKAIGTQQAPSGKIVSALALFLTFFIMEPVWIRVRTESIVPFSQNEITEEIALNRACEPLKEFMLRQTRENTLLTFMEMGNIPPVQNPQQLPMRVVIPSFMVSELQTAFQMGFLIYLPFLVIDAVVATFLMSMGMMMLPPMMVSLPFKLLLFTMVDGWRLVVRALVTSFTMA